MDIEKTAIELSRLDYAVKANIATAAIFTEMINKYHENPASCTMERALFLAHVAKTYIRRADGNNARMTQLIFEMHEEYRKLFGHDYNGESE